MDNNKEEYFYILQISVEPGGARKHDIHVLSRLIDVHQILQEDLVKDAGLAIWYGEDIFLHRCKCSISQGQRTYEVIETINLHPKITYHVGDFAPMKFNEDDEIIGYHKSDIFGPKYNFNDPDPIDFQSKDINEVYRYLYYDTLNIFRIIAERGDSGSNMEQYPPTIGVQIDLHGIPRIENPLRRFHFPIEITLNEDTLKLKDLFTSLE